jgi:hypothetical protein
LAQEHQGRRSIRAGGASGQVEQFVGKSDRLRAGCGQNIGVDWADSRFDREKWLAPLTGREGAMAAERVGGQYFGAWEEVSLAG